LYGDAARTIPVGKVSPEALALIDATRASLFEGINAAKGGNRIGDIGHAVQAYVEKRGYPVS
jgi:methionyl aminopeptidase